MIRAMAGHFTFTDLFNSQIQTTRGIISMGYIVRNRFLQTTDVSVETNIFVAKTAMKLPLMSRTLHYIHKAIFFDEVSEWH
jgi:hypothetical protein